jgi:hypothetical protein
MREANLAILERAVAFRQKRRVSADIHGRDCSFAGHIAVRSQPGIRANVPVPIPLFRLRKLSSRSAECEFKQIACLTKPR